MANKHEHNTISDALLVRYLAGSASAAECNTVQQWLDSSEENKRYYEALRLAAAYAQPEVPTAHIDEEQEWKVFKANRDKAGDSRKGVVVLLNRRLMRIAALLVLVIGVAVFYLVQHSRAGQQLAITSGEAVVTKMLPDGSGITLNKKSTLYYSPSTYHKHRSVRLAGEAFFAIAPHKEAPFVVDLPDARVEVVGTSFNINTTENKTAIIVETGEVQVKKGSLVFRLRAGEKATLYKGDGLPVKQSSTDSLYKYYRTKNFVCNGTPLRELLTALNTAYNLHLSLLYEQDGELPITVTFTNKPAEDIIAVICSTLQLTTIKRGNEIILKKRSEP